MDRHRNVDPQFLQDGTSRLMSAIFAVPVCPQILQRKESESDSVMRIEPPVILSDKLSEHLDAIIMNR